MKFHSVFKKKKKKTIDVCILVDRFEKHGK